MNKIRIVFIILLLLILTSCKTKVIISFDSDGGTLIEDISVHKNNKVNQPEDPTKDGFNFIEWQLDGESFDFNNKVTKNIVLVAVWEEKKAEKLDVSIISIEIESENILKKDEEYFLHRLEDYKIIINLDNEEEYVINSLKISGSFYYIEDFNEESTNKKIIIDSNTSNNTGRTLIEIEEISYFANNVEKYETFTNKNVVLNVEARFNPVVNFEDEIPGFENYELILDVVDRDNIIDFNKNAPTLFLYENDIEVKKVNLSIDINLIELTNLKLGTNYSYEVIGNYDLYDGEGIKEYKLIEGQFTTLEPFQIANLFEDETEIEFNLKMVFDVTLDSLKVYQNEEFITNLDLADKKITNLNPGTDYKIVFEYSYQYLNNTISQIQKFGMSTYKLYYEDVIRNGRVVKQPDGRTVQIPSYKRQTEEVRGIWVSTVSNIDLPKIQGSDIEGYKNTIKYMFDNIKAANFNTIFFQIRPMNDAFYPSELAPWSRYITGTEGKDPGFDLLEFVIEEAHIRGLELHGWLNPYRVATSQGMFSGMDYKNFAVRHPNYLLTGSNGATILNPGIVEVQTYVRDVINEIITNYPTINGIHFDDYFYLDNFGENENSPDYETYLNNRTSNSQSIADFRRMSVTNMIRGIYEDVEEFNDNNDTYIKFGISPSGVWANKGTHPEGSSTAGYQHYSQLYADTKAWINEGIIHYIIPQIYWNFTLSAAPYAHLVDWWSNVVKDTNVDLIIGMGLYRYREGTWPTYEIADQLRYNQNHPEVKGSVFFTYQDIVSSQYERLKTVRTFIFENYWNKEAKVPWESNVK